MWDVKEIEMAKAGERGRVRGKVYDWDGKGDDSPGSRKPRPLAADECANLWPGCRPTGTLVRCHPDSYRDRAPHFSFWMGHLSGMMDEVDGGRRSRKVLKSRREGLLWFDLP